ncbi:MAG: SDR family oxidoreductase [Chloroflexota bacterium]|nr:SDR family oxidoreductase [Chloroflexota bacterium]
MFTLSGKRALVTGGGRGIGRAIVLALSSAGADVAVTARSLLEIEAVAGVIRSAGGKALPVTCDVTDPLSVGELARRVEDAFGGLDILVNNAGSAQSHKFVDHPDELWHRMLDTNLTSVYYVTKAFAPMLVESGGGRIINIASTAARVGDRYVVAYTAAKHGVLGLTRALAAELVGQNVTVNAICPGYVDTPMTEATIDNITARTGKDAEEARWALEKMSLQKRLIEPEEVAALALFLAAESSRGINGQAINIDGGTVMS